METDIRIKNSVGRPKGKNVNPDTTTFRHNKIHKLIIEDAMLEFGESKSETIRHIILEWNMLRYRSD